MNELKLILVHDGNSCPIVSERSQGHGKCWKLRERDGFDLPEGLGATMTGEEVYRLLSSGTFEDSVTVRLEIDDSLDRPDIYVYNEDSWVRSLLRKYNLFLSYMAEGSFLRTDELWEVFFFAQNNSVGWNAQSTVSDKKWTKYDKTFRIDPTKDLDEIGEEFLDVITDMIPSEKISEFSSLRADSAALFASLGFGDKGPLCRLSVTNHGRTFTVKIVQVGADESVVLTNNFTVEPDEPSEAVLQGLIGELTNGGLSQYNIENTDDFLKNISDLLDTLESESTSELNKEDVDDSFEGELLGVISEYRMELQQGKDVAIYLAQSLKQLVTLRVEQEQFDAVSQLVDECKELLEPRVTQSEEAQRLFLEIEELGIQTNPVKG